MTKGLFRLNIRNHQAYTCSRFKGVEICTSLPGLYQHHMKVLPFEKLILSILPDFQTFTSRVLKHEPKYSNPEKKYL